MPRTSLKDAKGKPLTLHVESPRLAHRAYSFRLPAQSIPDFVAGLDLYQKTAATRRLTLAAPDAASGRLTYSLTDSPAYESSLRGQYLRGTNMKVSVGASAANIELNAPGAEELKQKIKTCLGHDVIITAQAPSGRRRDHLLLIQRADDDSDEQARLADAASQLAGSVIPSEDFSDWEKK